MFIKRRSIFINDKRSIMTRVDMTSKPNETRKTSLTYINISQIKEDMLKQMSKLTEKMEKQMNA